MILRPPGDGRHPTVSVVSVNYNGRRYLDRFLQSVLALDYPPACYRVAVVDNASTDGSVELLRKQFPQVCLVQAGRNLGFAGGCNLGIRATASDYVALVNNDTVVEPSWLRALVEVAESDPRVGLAGSKSRPIAEARRMTPRRRRACVYHKARDLPGIVCPANPRDTPPDAASAIVSPSRRMGAEQCRCGAVQVW